MSNATALGAAERGAEPSGLRLPDPAAAGPFRPFTTDPGWREAWWWLGVPVVIAVLLIAIYAVAPGWYEAWIHPEGYGALEVGHFLIPLAGFVIAVRLAFRPFVRKRRLVLATAVIGAIGCFYIAGEEHSWGQHLFGWQTPEGWSAINRQDETNLHNIVGPIGIFEKNPRTVLEIGIVLGGLLIPALAPVLPWLRRGRLSLFLPAAAIVPTALGAMLFKLSGMLQNVAGLPALVFRPSEAAETYYYLFILIYLIVFARRIREIEAAEAEG